MPPERQKGHVYYRCQTPDCPTKTIREDQISKEVYETLKGLEIRPDRAAKLERDWQRWIDSSERQDEVRSLELRIAQCEQRLARLTDLLIDFTITQNEYNDRKRRLTMELVDLKDDRQKANEIGLSNQDMALFLELMKNLAQLHISAKPPEKRWMVENCFSNRTVTGRELCLEPSNWLQVRGFSSLTPLVTQDGPLLELLSAGKIPVGQGDELAVTPRPLKVEQNDM